MLRRYGTAFTTVSTAALLERVSPWRCSCSPIPSPNPIWGQVGGRGERADAALSSFVAPPPPNPFIPANFDIKSPPGATHVILRF